MPSDVTTPADSKTTTIEATTRFQDGLGVRVATTDAFGEPIEHLKVCPDLAALDSAIRERVSRLINFRHVRYVRLRGTDRLTNPEKDVVVAYDAVTGARVSELLDLASHTPLRVDIDVALQIVRELLPAVAVLHDSRNVTHGALGPERLVITNQGRLIIVDHGLGLALGKLGYSRRRYWQQLAVAVPPGSGKVAFDARTDVIQIGVVALALILGRQIGRDEYPDDMRRLVGGARELTAKGEWRAMSSELQSWLERMLPTDHRQQFMTVREAQQSFESLVSHKRYAPSAAGLKTIITRYYSLIENKADAVSAPAAPAVVPAAAAAAEPQIVRATPVAVTPAAAAPPAPHVVEVKAEPPTPLKVAVSKPTPPVVTPPPAPTPKVVAPPAPPVVEKAEKAEKAVALSVPAPVIEKIEKVEKVERFEKFETKVEKVEKVEKVDKAEKAKPVAPLQVVMPPPVAKAVPPVVPPPAAPVVAATPTVVTPPPAPAIVAKKPAAPPTALKGTLDETTLPQIAARPGRSARASEPPPTFSSEPETSATAPSGLEIGPIADSVTPARRRSRRGLVMPFDDSMSREALTRSGKLAASSRVVTQTPKPTPPAPPVPPKPIVPVTVAKSVTPVAPPAPKAPAPPVKAATPVVAPPPVVSTPVAPPKVVAPPPPVETYVPEAEIDAPTIPSRSLIPAIVASASTSRMKATPPAAPAAPKPAAVRTDDDELHEALRALEQEDPSQVRFDKEILIGRRHDDAEPMTIEAPTAASANQSVAKGDWGSPTVPANQLSQATQGKPAKQAEKVDAGAPDAAIAAKAADAIAPKPAELSAFQEVAEDTYQHAEASLALKDMVSPASKSAVSGIDPSAILQMTAVDDSTSLASDIITFEAAADIKPAAVAKAAESKPVIESKPIPESKPVAQSKAVAEPKPVVEVKPVGEAKPAVEVKPAVDVVRPAVEARPAIVPKLTVEAKSPVEAKPLVEAKAPVEANPAVVAKPPVESKSIAEAKPAVDAKPAASEPKPGSLSKGSIQIQVLKPAIAPPLPVLPPVQAKAEPPKPPAPVEKPVAPAESKPAAQAKPPVEKIEKIAAQKAPVAEKVPAPVPVAPTPAVATLVTAKVPAVAIAPPPPIVVVPPPVPAVAPPLVAAVPPAPPLPAPPPLTTPVASPIVAATASPAKPALPAPTPVAMPTPPPAPPPLVTTVAPPVVAVTAPPAPSAPSGPPAPPAPPVVPVAVAPPVSIASVLAAPEEILFEPAAMEVTPVAAASVPASVIASTPTPIAPLTPIAAPIASNPAPVTVIPLAATPVVATPMTTPVALPVVVPSVSATIPSTPGLTKKSGAAAAAFWNTEEAPQDAVLPAWARGVELNGVAVPDPSVPPLPSGPLGASPEASSAYTALGPPVVPVSSTAPGSRLRMWLRRSKGGGEIGTGTTDVGLPASSGTTYKLAPSLGTVMGPMDSSGSSLLNGGGGFLGAASVEEASRATTRIYPRARVNWRRTLAASMVVALLEGVAFGAAYWYVVPTETGSLVIETTPPGIDILVDGRVSGHTPYSGALAPGRHVIELRQGTNTRVLPVEISAGVQTWQRVTWSKGLRTGQARVTSTAPNARVTLDGHDLGVTPLTISTLSAGKHMVTVESNSGTVNTPMTVSPGETTELDVPVYPGWVSVLAAVELQIFEGERFLGTTESEKLLFAPGRHKLDFVSESLGYRHSQIVMVTPGGTSALSIVMPKVAVQVDGPAGTELFVDGEVAGKLPMKDLRLPLGTREFVFKLTGNETRRQVVVLTNKAPMKIAVPQ